METKKGKEKREKNTFRPSCSLDTQPVGLGPASPPQGAIKKVIKRRMLQCPWTKAPSKAVLTLPAFNSLAESLHTLRDLFCEREGRKKPRDDILAFATSVLRRWQGVWLLEGVESGEVGFIKLNGYLVIRVALGVGRFVEGSRDNS